MQRTEQRIFEHLRNQMFKHKIFNRSSKPVRDDSDLYNNQKQTTFMYRYVYLYSPLTKKRATNGTRRKPYSVFSMHRIHGIFTWTTVPAFKTAPWSLQRVHWLDHVQLLLFHHNRINRQKLFVFLVHFHRSTPPTGVKIQKRINIMLTRSFVRRENLKFAKLSSAKGKSAICYKMIKQEKYENELRITINHTRVENCRKLKAKNRNTNNIDTRRHLTARYGMNLPTKSKSSNPDYLLAILAIILNCTPVKPGW